MWARYRSIICTATSRLSFAKYRKNRFSYYIGKRPLQIGMMKFADGVLMSCRGVLGQKGT